ncbi:LOW QUALITY PROTEIN: hypothetical protein HJC23_011556 [Cyclotella cryptica]|uniref:Uncharacterized protein n=1 Tax=Cyclotella cryptica TaxID=29204 RepID=A0ABD3NZX8_9STRA
MNKTNTNLASVLEAMFPSLFAQRLIDAIMVECRQDVEAREGRYVREVRTDQRHSSVTPERISCAFGIGLNAAKQTIAVTTQKGIQHEINPLSRKYYYAKPRERPEEDDVALDAYDKLFGTQIKLDDGLKASIKRHVTDLNGIPIGTAHVNMLLDTRQHEMEFKDGTTDAYFANIIAKKLYSQVDSGGHGLVAFKEISDHRKNQHAISKDDGYMDFTRKEHFVANGSKTEASLFITYSSVVTQDSVSVALNNLDIMSCNILGNAYLYAPFREKIWFRAGIEYGDHKGKAMIVTRALYGLKSSGGGASWRAMFAESLRQMGWESTTVDSDVYQRKCHKGAGTPYYELLLVYADNCMAVMSMS